MTNETKIEAKIETTNDADRGEHGDPTKASGGPGVAVAVGLAWLAVGIPLLWGVVQTLRRSLALFG